MMIYHFSGEMGPDFSPKMAVKSLTSQQIVRIHQLFRQAKFDDPSGDVRYSLSSSMFFMSFLSFPMLTICGGLFFLKVFRHVSLVIHF